MLAEVAFTCAEDNSTSVPFESSRERIFNGLPAFDV